MPFIKYTPQIKVIALNKWLLGQSIPSINHNLLLDISRKSFSRWKLLYEHTHSVIRDPATYAKRGRPTVYSREDREFMLELIDDDPTLFLDEIQEAMYDHTDIIACRQTIANDLKDRLFLTVHKAAKVDPKQSPDLRAAYSMRIANIPSKCLVFMDETGLRTQDVMRDKVRSKRGERPVKLKRKRNGPHYSMLAAICEMGLLAVHSKMDAYLRTDFEAFMKHLLLPVMNRYPARNSVLVLDNCTIHHGGEIEQMCNEMGIVVRYLSPYSPDWNPIERIFDVFKDRLRRNRMLNDAADRLDCMLVVMSEVSTSSLIMSLYKTCGYEEG